MKRISRKLLFLFFVAIALLNSSCSKYDYTDKLRGLGERVESLEEKAEFVNGEVKKLSILFEAIENNGFIKELVQNTDGSYTITFNNDKKITIRNGKDGKKGEDLTLEISARKDTDGVWYFTLNGDWLYDSNGEKMRASGIDGENGKVIGEFNYPYFRINSTTNVWEYTTDGGITWLPTGVSANGKDGTDGSNDLFINAVDNGNGTVTFYLANGTQCTIAIMSNL